MWVLAFVCLGVLGSVVKLLLVKPRGNGIAPIVISCVEWFLSLRAFQVNVSGILFQTAEAINGDHVGFVVGLILFATYINELLDNVSADSLLCADDVKSIAPPP